MAPADVQRAELRTFLLGGADEATADALALRLLDEEGLLARVEEAEDDLVEEFVRGEMPPADRESFLGRFLTTEDRRQRLRVAQAVYQESRSWTGPTVASPAPETAAAPARRFRYAFVAAGSMAACALLATGVSFSTWRETRRLQASLDAVTSRLAQPGTESSPAPLSFALTVSRQTRGTDDPLAATAIQVPESVRSIQLQLVLGAPSANQYVVTITTGSGVQVWSRAGLTPQQGTITAIVPTDALAAGTYDVVASDAAGTEAPYTYRFRLSR